MQQEYEVRHGGAENPKASFLASRGRMVLIGFLAIAGFYLVTEHTAHLFGALPYLLVLACPLMHIFMHGGHGKHRGQGSRGDTANGALPDQGER